MGEEAFEEFVIFDRFFFIVAPDTRTRNHVTFCFFFLPFLGCSFCIGVHFAVLVHAGFCQFSLKIIGLGGFGGLLLFLFLEGCRVEFAIGGRWCFVATVCCLVLGFF